MVSKWLKKTFSVVVWCLCWWVVLVVLCGWRRVASSTAQVKLGVVSPQQATTLLALTPATGTSLPVYTHIQDQLRVIATKNRLSHYFEGDFIVLHIDRIWNESILSSYSDFWNVPFDKYMKYRAPNYKH